MHADATSVRLENEVCSDNEGECVGEIKGLFITKQIKKPRLCCSVAKHLGSGYSTQEVGRNS